MFYLQRSMLRIRCGRKFQFYFYYISALAALEFEKGSKEREEGTTAKSALQFSGSNIAVQ